jgi:hypothetical protein
MSGEYYAEAMVSPAPKYLLDRSSGAASAMIDEVAADAKRLSQSPFLKQIHLEFASPEAPLICVCLLDIDAVGVPGSIKGMIQAKIDRMEELDQTVLKTASILGRRFTRKMFKYLLQVHGVDDLSR